MARLTPLSTHCLLSSGGGCGPNNCCKRALIIGRGGNAINLRVDSVVQRLEIEMLLLGRDVKKGRSVDILGARGSTRLGPEQKPRIGEFQPEESQARSTGNSIEVNLTSSVGSLLSQDAFV